MWQSYQSHYDTDQHFNKGVFLPKKTAAYLGMYSFATMQSLTVLMMEAAYKPAID
jgi:hypothetical protein